MSEIIQIPQQLHPCGDILPRSQIPTLSFLQQISYHYFLIQRLLDYFKLSLLCPTLPVCVFLSARKFKESNFILSRPQVRFQYKRYSVQVPIFIIAVLLAVAFSAVIFYCYTWWKRNRMEHKRAFSPMTSLDVNPLPDKCMFNVSASLWHDVAKIRKICAVCVCLEFFRSRVISSCPSTV